MKLRIEKSREKRICIGFFFNLTHKVQHTPVENLSSPEGYLLHSEETYYCITGNLLQFVPGQAYYLQAFLTWYNLESGEFPYLMSCYFNDFLNKNERTQKSFEKILVLPGNYMFFFSICHLYMKNSYYFRKNMKQFSRRRNLILGQHLENTLFCFINSTKKI